MLYPLNPLYGFAELGVADGGCWFCGVYGPAVFGLICWGIPLAATAVLTLSVGVEYSALPLNPDDCGEPLKPFCERPAWGP